jgi:hypothetical protein
MTDECLEAVSRCPVPRGKSSRGDHQQRWREKKRSVSHREACIESSGRIDDFIIISRETVWPMRYVSSPQFKYLARAHDAFTVVSALFVVSTKHILPNEIFSPSNNQSKVLSRGGIRCFSCIGKASLPARHSSLDY